MVLVDFNGMAVGSILGQLNKGMELSEGLVKHIILNNLRMYRNKYPEREHGRMIICTDSWSWRREIFPEYKARRTDNKEKDDRDWDEIFRLISVTTEDIKENFPYAVISVDSAEADDIIGALTMKAMENPMLGEDVVIISGDKDFIQLHENGVIQYAPMQQKMVKEDNPARYIFDHIMKGDKSDGVPNVLSPDNSFTDKIRQAPMRKKQLDEWWEQRDNLKGIMEPEIFRNYIRNRELIDLNRMPEKIKEESIRQLENYKYPNRTNILSYLIDNNMKMLIECAGEF